MSENVSQPAAPSLEDILWRAMDRFAERPTVLDAEEFSARIAGAFDGEVPEESFVDRFVEGNPELARDADLADAIVRSTASRLHVYDFDLGHLDYVVIEEEEEVLVVSEFGQFALPNDRPAQQAIAAAVVRDAPAPLRCRVERGAVEPRAYLVRQNGDLIALDVQKLAAAVARLPVKQVSAPPVERPPLRLLPFDPRPRRLTRRSEARALREHDRRTTTPVAAVSRTGGLDDGAIDDARPSTAAPTVFVLLPDGSLAQPQMGAATRWHRMVSDWVLRAGLLASSGSSVSVSAQRFTVDSGKVSAVFTGSESRLAPGAVGSTAAARGDGVVAARADFAPVRVLGDDDLAQAVVAGTARIVAGWTAAVPVAGATRDRYWMQPETIFSPSGGDRELVARADPAAGLDAPPEPELVAAGEPLQLGQITGDPWADWALQVSEGGESAPLAAKQSRRRAPAEIRVRGEPVVAFRAPDGTVLVNGERGTIRLAANDRPRQEGESPDGAALGDAAPSGAVRMLRDRRMVVAPRAGALPATALSALGLSLQRTAAAGAYKVPVAAFVPGASEVEQPVELERDERRQRTFEHGGPRTAPDARGGKAARLVLSLPFPNAGEIHVGPDLAGALDTYLDAPVVPAPAAPAETALPPSGAARETPMPSPVRVTQPHTAAVPQPARARSLDHADFPAPPPRLPEREPVLRPAGVDEVLPSLPPLLRDAVVAAGEFRPGPGAPLPAVIRPHRLAGAFAEPELVVEPDAEPAAPRPLGPGEDEIVIPTPLWAHMGRGQSSSTPHVMASPIARTSYAPPLGTYTVIKPGGFRPLSVAPPGTPGIVELAGPTSIRLRPALQGAVRAESTGGKLVLGHVPLDDGESLVTSRGRIRVGEPLDAKAAAAARRAAAQRAPEATVAAPRSGAGQLPHEGPAPAGAPGVRATPPPTVAVPRAPLGAPAAARVAVPSPRVVGPDATLHPAQAASRDGSMAGALRSAMRAADDLDQRVLPPRPAPGPLASAEGIAAPPSKPRIDAPAAPAAELVVSAPPSGIEGLPPGAWSGTHPGAPSGYVPWSYSAEPRRGTATAVGGIRLADSSRPGAVALPTGMRFRYVAAPLWWSTALRSESGERQSRRGLHAAHPSANSAAAIWRSIFVAGDAAGDLSGGMDRGHDAPAGGLSNVERRMDVLVALGLVGGGKAAATAAPTPARRGPETIYVAMDDQGRAGPASADQVRRAHALARSVEMRIVAAMPPSPPPLHTMGSGAPAHSAQAPVLARQRHAPGGEHKADDTSSQSQIEGSVDAIAQRIYHRIRQRIASDRERFGG